jgi:hypothetical protein
MEKIQKLINSILYAPHRQSTKTKSNVSGEINLKIQE